MMGLSVVGGPVCSSAVLPNCGQPHHHLYPVLFPFHKECSWRSIPNFLAPCESHSIELDESVASRLEAYARSLWSWNEQLNLTRHTTWDLFVGRDLRDCVNLAPLLKPGEEVLDLGSGNGIPGIPLAILRDDIEVALAESVAKRANALGEIIAELELPLPVYGARGEDLAGGFSLHHDRFAGGRKHRQILSLGQPTLGRTWTGCC